MPTVASHPRLIIPMALQWQQSVLARLTAERPLTIQNFPCAAIGIPLLVRLHQHARACDDGRRRRRDDDCGRGRSPLHVISVFAPAKRDHARPRIISSESGGSVVVTLIRSFLPGWFSASLVVERWSYFDEVEAMNASSSSERACDSRWFVKSFSLPPSLRSFVGCEFVHELSR